MSKKIMDRAEQIPSLDSFSEEHAASLLRLRLGTQMSAYGFIEHCLQTFLRQRRTFEEFHSADFLAHALALHRADRRELLVLERDRTCAVDRRTRSERAVLEVYRWRSYRRADRVWYRRGRSAFEGSDDSPRDTTEETAMPDDGTGTSAYLGSNVFERGWTDE